jgi:hypothetical protein
MVWVVLFIVGLFVVLAGVIPLILNGARGGNSTVAVLGAVLLVAGGSGVIAKPSFLALRMPRLVFGEAEAPQIEPPKPAAVAPAEPAAEPPHDEASAEPAAPKDESQLQPAKLPQPLSVTTTTVVGHEVDPIANPSAAPEGAADAAPITTAAVPPAPKAPDLSALAGQQTADEKAFTKAVSDARNKYQAAGDEDRMSLQSSRAAAICNAVKQPAVQSWIGAIKEIDKDAGGRTIVAVALPDGTLVKTWNNAMSDVEDKTLILPGSPLAATLGKLDAGDTVRFSGTFFTDEPDCYRSSRLSLDQSMLEPSFLFRFTEVQKI